MTKNVSRLLWQPYVDTTPWVSIAHLTWYVLLLTWYAQTQRWSTRKGVLLPSRRHYGIKIGKCYDCAQLLLWSFLVRCFKNSLLYGFFCVTKISCFLSAVPFTKPRFVCTPWSKLMICIQRKASKVFFYIIYNIHTRFTLITIMCVSHTGLTYQGNK